MSSLNQNFLKQKQRYALLLNADKGTICNLGEIVSAKYQIATKNGISSLRKVVEDIGGVISRPIGSLLERGEDVTSLYVYPEIGRSKDELKDEPKFIAYIDNRYAKGHYKYGDRFRIAHELGHYFLHAKLYNLYEYKDGKGLVKRRKDEADLLKRQVVLANFWGGHYYKNLNSTDEADKEAKLMTEAEAYNFSMSMLMPKLLFNEHWNGIESNILEEMKKEINGCSISEATDIVRNNDEFSKEIGEMSSFFKVSSKRILGRAICLGLIKVNMDSQDME